MPAGGLLLAQLTTVAGRPSTITILLWCGLAVFTVLFGVLTSTQWGQQKPLVKCLGLSLFAHLLLLTAMWGTRVFCPRGASVAGDPQGVEVRIDADLTMEPVEQANAAPPVETPPVETASARASIAPPLLATPSKTTPPADSVVPDPTGTEPPTPEAADPPQEAKPIEPPPRPPEAFVAQPAEPVRPADGKPVPEVYRNRSAANRQAQLQRFGGTPDTEAAVAAALDWLAAHQHTDGRWIAAAFGAGKETKTLGQDRGGAGAKADTGITALALLAFLGAGETHYGGQQFEARHRENVQRGLEFLVASQASNGSLAGQSELFAQMYCHGMATLALSEAWALTGDERLADPVRRAIRYTLDSQHAGGGWRYQPLDQGDLSQFGWQLMALKSAETSGLAIPDSTRQRMIQFLRSVSSGTSKGLAAYRPSERPSRTMTAEAVMCRVFLNAENSPAAVDEAMNFVREEAPGVGRTNYYYWYYGTIATFQRQGPAWTEWNAAMQQRLLSTQRADSEMVGTWDPDAIWGGYGGRIYSTALAALCLEVYYRYLPLYGDQERLTSQPERNRR